MVEVTKILMIFHFPPTGFSLQRVKSTPTLNLEYVPCLFTWKQRGERERDRERERERESKCPLNVIGNSECKAYCISWMSIYHPFCTYLRINQPS